MTDESIFASVIKIESHKDRVAHIEQVCEGDADLRDRVQALLDAYENPDQLFNSPAAIEDADSRPGETVDHTPITEAAGQTIGPYKLREQIGEGGMGVVFVAERLKPPHMQVALKVVKPGMDSNEVIARFEAERQALALMDHDNIARVLDGGMTETGRPYFVMELVRGVPITNYCDEQKLNVGQRLSLFIQVCHAIQHAHQKAVIHRDIKPTNVLVTERDGTAIPKVIDFGVAKAIGHRLVDQSIYTQFRQVIGTPLYMSPEQAVLSERGVDTRSDVYSLGVLLYELLTGTTPFDQRRLEEAGMDAFRNIIQEEEPAKPSTRISTLGDTATRISANRGVEPSGLRNQVHGDLDWIVMKTLEKDRTRRFDTPSALAADIQRHLNGDAVEARPPSTSYQLWKFARRHKVALGTVFTIGVVLLLATLISTYAAFFAIVAKNEMDKARRRAEGSEKTAKLVAGEKERQIYNLTIGQAFVALGSV